MNALADDFLRWTQPVTVEEPAVTEKLDRTVVAPYNLSADQYAMGALDRSEPNVTGALTPTASRHLLNNDYLPRVSPLARSEIVAEWHGQVTKVLPDSFLAELKGVVGQDVGGSLEEAEIPTDEVRDDDTDLVRVGAFFRLCISYELATTGTRRRFTEVIFRRLPAYRREELDQAATEAADILRAIRVE